MSTPASSIPPERVPKQRSNSSLWKRVAGGLLACVWVVVCAGVWWLKSPAGEAWLRTKAEQALNDAMGSGRAELVGLSNAGLGELTIERLTLLDAEGPVLEIHEADIAVRLWPLLRGEVRVGETEIGRVSADLRLESGKLNLQTLFEKPQDDEEPAGKADYAVDSIQVAELQVRYRDQERDLQLEDGVFSGGLESTETGIRIHDVEFQGSLEQELLAFTLEEGVFGDAQVFEGLEAQGRNSHVHLSGLLSSEEQRVEIQEALVDGSILREVLGPEWDEEVRLTGAGGHKSGESWIQGSVQGLGGSVDIHLEERAGLVEGRVDAQSLELQRIQPELGEEASVNGALSILSSPREALKWTLSMDRVVLMDEVIEGLQASGVWVGEAAEQVSVTVAHEAGTVEFQGEVDREKLAGRLTAGVSSLSVLDQRGIAGVRGRLEARGALSVDWDGGVWASFEGGISGTQMGFPGGVEVGGVEGPLELHYRDGQVRAEGGVKGQQGQMERSSFGAFFGGWQVDLVEGQPLQWEADVEAEALDHLGIEIGGVSAGFRGLGAELDGRVDLEATSYRHLRWPSAEALVRLEEELSIRIDMVDEGGKPWALDLRQSGDTVDLAELVVSLDGGAWSLTDSVQAALSSELQEVQNLILQSASGETLKLGFRRSPGEVFAELETANFPLAALDTLLGETGHTGEVSANIRVEKQGLSPSIQGRVSGRKMLIPGRLHGARLDVEFTPGPEGQGVEFFLGRGKKSLASANLSLPVGGGMGMLDWNGPFTADFLLMPSDNRVFENVIPVLPDLPKGWTASRISVSGTLLQPKIEAETGFEWMLLEGPEFFRGDLRLRHQGDGLSVDSSIRQSGRPIMRTKGNLQTGVPETLAWLSGSGSKPPLHLWDHWWRGGQVRVLAKKMELSTVRSALPFDVPIDGLLSGSVLIEGKPSSPRASVGLSLSEGRMGEVELPVAMISVNPGEEGYEVFSYSRIGEEELRLDGSLGIDLKSDRLLRDKLRDENLSLSLNGAVPLAILEAWTPRMDSAEGAVVVSGGIEGSILSPKPKLKLGLDRGRLDWLPEGITVQSASFTGSVDTDGVRIPRFAIKTAPMESLPLSLREHKSRITGSVVWPFDPEADASMEVAAQDAWLAAVPGRILRVDGGVSAEGSPSRMEVRGSVAINEGRYELTPGQWLAEDALMLDPTIHLNRRIETMDRVESEEAGESRWHYAMEIDLGQNTWIDAEIPLSSGYGQVASKVSTVGLEGRLEGQLQATGAESGPLLQGEVDVRKGKAKVFGTDFVVETGALVFSGASVSNPDLDIRAVYPSSQYGDIRVDIGGRPAAMSLAFSSTEGWSETDMASILLFRVPASSMTQSEGGAGLDLIGAAIGVMAGQASNFLQMSRVVDRVEVESTGDAISAIRLGWSIGDDLFVTFSQDYTAEMDENQSEVTLEWLLSRRLQAEVSTGDAGESSADLYMRWRF